MGEIEMARYGMLIDCGKCIGCYNCFLSCQDEFCGNAYEGYSAAAPMSGHDWMRVIDKERGQFPRVKVAYIPKTCMHCEDAPCIAAAQNNAVYRRPDGIVMIDPQKAKGQKHVAAACPYRVIDWNGEEQVPQKCIMCAHLLDHGEKEPRCVEACPTHALIFGDLDDPKSELSKMLKLNSSEKLCPEFNLKEKVLYHGLPNRFISGTVVYKDKDECAENLLVELYDGTAKKVSMTNAFGDFEFEGLPADKTYHVIVGQSGYKKEKLEIKTYKDVHIGEIYLVPKRKTDRKG
jgi:Fe-S-cluster-containing dehydrogenase component